MQHLLLKSVLYIFALYIVCGPTLAANKKVTSSKGILKVGAAKIDISPAINPDYPPSGNYAHERLYVRVIVLDNGETRAVLIGADLSGISEVVWLSGAQQLAKLLDTKIENILISATHTHGSGPAGPPLPRIPGKTFDDQAERIIQAMLTGATQARANLKIATVGFGEGMAYLNVNRDAISDKTHLWTQASNLEGPSDKTLAVLAFNDEQGKPIAAYMNYAMHPVSSYLVGFTSADFPGAASHHVEQAFDNKMVMIFTQGASGDQNPLHMRLATNVLAAKSGVDITGYELVREPIEAPLRDGRLPHGALEPKIADQLANWMEAQGQLLGEEAIRIMTLMNMHSGEVRLQGKQQMLTCPGRKRTDSGREGKPGSYIDADNVDIRLSMLGIGDIALTAVNGEVYSLIGQRMKAKSTLANTMMMTLTNGRANSGYIVNDEMYGANTFQVLGSSLQPGCAAGGIVNELSDMIQAYQE